MIIHTPRVTPSTETPRKEPSIGTLSGELISLANPQPDRIHLEDVAAGLANACRWGGQIESRYSVAQHAIACALVGRELELPVSTQMVLLHHDDSEAYLCDLPRPLKHTLSDYGEVEHRFILAIAAKFRLPYPWTTEVHQIDYAMLLAESQLFDRPRFWFHEEDFASPLVGLCRFILCGQRAADRIRHPGILQEQFINHHYQLEACLPEGR